MPKVNWSYYVEDQENKLTNQIVDRINSLEIDADNVQRTELANANSIQTMKEFASEIVEEKCNLAENRLLHKTIHKELVENNNGIEVRKLYNSSLYSVKTFEALHLKPNLLKGVYEMGFTTPSKIQAITLPILLANPLQNLIAQSQSGSGKTAAFVLAMLGRVDTDKHYPQVLCLSPTYELAIQTGKVAAHMAKFCSDIKLKYAVCGEELPKGRKLTEHIIIGTPGKVLDWGIKYRSFDFSKIVVFVLNKADVMISKQEHQDQWIRIHKCLSPSCQMMFFSATYDTEVMSFAEIIIQNPLIIKLKASYENIEQYYVKCAHKDKKYEAVTNIYETIGVGQAIIFCHTRHAANWLAGKMSKDGHAVAVLTGELTVEQRISVLDRFRNSQEKVLITTNVLSRELKFDHVTMVVNFDLPVDLNGRADYETYLYRIGQTGRVGKKGIAINLVDSAESLKICKDIEAHFNSKINYLNVEDSDELEKIRN